MSIIRLYTGDDGQTHIEEMSPESHPELASLQSTTGIVFRTVEPGYFSDWHNAPRRQYVILLAGQMEIGLNDGTRRQFGPGDAVLASDLTGSGHTTKAVGADPALVAVVPLAE